MAMRHTSSLVVAVLTSALIPASAQAQKRPIQIALVTPIQIFPETDTVVGVRLNVIYGRNASVIGLDVGIANHTTTGPFKGLQFGIVGIADSKFIGWQYNWVNITKDRFEGFQSGIVNLVGDGGGFQYAAVNHAREMKGFQLGIVNYAEQMGGFQLGLVNYARRTSGLQIGLLNIIREGGTFPFFPIVNWSF